jgi:hypothetical protein
MIDPYNHEDDDDQPTLQRAAPSGSSARLPVASPVFDAFQDEATTATDLDVLGAVGPLTPLAPLGPIAHASVFEDVDTEKMPVDVRAGLVRASQVDDGA